MAHLVNKDQVATYPQQFWGLYTSGPSDTPHVSYLLRIVQHGHLNTSNIGGRMVREYYVIYTKYIFLFSTALIGEITHCQYPSRLEFHRSTYNLGISKIVRISRDDLRALRLQNAAEKL